MDYSKLSWKFLGECLKNNPRDSPVYIQAKAERDLRLKSWAIRAIVVCAAVALITAAVLKIIGS